MKLHELLNYKNMTVFLIRMRVADRGEFKRVLCAYIRLIKTCESMFETEYLPTDFFFEQFDYDLSIVANALGYIGVADDINYEIDRQRKIFLENVDAKMKEMNKK